LPVIILLPPSEGKAECRRGRPLDLATLSLPGLSPARERVLESLVTLCAQPDGERASAVLGLSPGLRQEVHRNAQLRRAAAMPAGRLYTGVLYDALDLASLSRPAYRLLERSVLVFSALWGAVRIGDRIPPYRCSIGVNLPGLGALAGYWRQAMPAAMAEAAGGGLVLDLRSTAYATMWSPPAEVVRRTAWVRVLHERVVNGVAKRSVVSHFNKATKGRLVRDLAVAGAVPRSPAALAPALRDLKYTVEEHSGSPWRLDVIITEL
jgi:cytoplasmic iron level regulating protein YaaA (DUF328/UPF0246 family)